MKHEEKTAIALGLGLVGVVALVAIANAKTKTDPAAIRVTYKMRPGENWDLAVQVSGPPWTAADTEATKKDLAKSAEVLAVGVAGEFVAFRLRVLAPLEADQNATIPWGRGSATLVHAERV